MTGDLADLTQKLAPGTVVTDDGVIEGYRRDQAATVPAGRPRAVIRPGTVAEVSTTLRWATKNSVPVVPRGAGTGLSGGANATDGAVVLDLSRMNQVLEIDRDNMVCVVQPGIVNNDLKAAVAEHGLWYPPDPASAPWSSIGGNVATNAGGLCCLKYGVTRDYVLGLRVVTGIGAAEGDGVGAIEGGDGAAAGYGDVVRLGRRTTKGVAGLDLTALMVGSEGTLGVITEVTLRLRPALPGTPRTIVGAFGGLVASGEAVSLITRRGLTPSVLEILDRACLTAVEEWKHLGLDADAAALLLARVDTPGDAGSAEADAIAAAMNDAGAQWVAQSTDAAEAEALFDARRLAYPALERLGPVLTEDVCVPRSAVPAMLGRIEAAAARHGVTVATIAHAGDGNLHPLLVTPPGDDAARIAAQAAFEEFLSDAIELGGTVSGEHGIGLLKRAGMRRELDPGALAMQEAVRRALDPLGLFNPGKG
jgi:glycolate oxidase